MKIRKYIEKLDDISTDLSDLNNKVLIDGLDEQNSAYVIGVLDSVVLTLDNIANALDSIADVMDEDENAEYDEFVGSSKK